MVFVDVLLSSSLGSIIGPVQTIKRLKRDKDWFSQSGYLLNFYTIDSLTSGIKDSLKKDSHFIKFLKKIARLLAMNSFLYAIVRVQLLYSPGKRLLKYYNSLKRNPDILVFHSVFDCYIYLKYYRMPNVKVALFIHADSTHHKMLITYFKRLKGTFVERKLNSINDYVISQIDALNCISEIAKKNFIEEQTIFSEKIRLVVNGIDDLTPEEKEEAKKLKGEKQIKKYCLTCVGSLNGRKGQDVIIKALSKLPKIKLRDFQFLIVGDGPVRSQLEEQVNSSELSEVVKFVGAIDNQNVFRYLAISNIYILMSLNEGLPLSMLEAIRMGLPVIANSISGIPEIVENGINGILLHEDNDGELVELFNEMDKYDWNKMGDNSRKVFENKFLFSRMRSDYLTMLRSLK